MPMDLRDFIDLMHEHGMVHYVDEEVDWNLEASAITAMCNRIDAPRPIFRNVKGYPKGYSLAGDIYAGSWRNPWRPTALSLGMDSNIPYIEFSEEIARRGGNPIKPVVVSYGPCKEEIHIGKDVDLFEFPWPYIHDGDGGRYGTISAIIAKDLDSDWVNWACYRNLIHSKNRLGMSFQRGQQTANMYYYKYEARNINMPCCIAVGGDPALFHVAAMAAGPGVSEVDIAGGLRMEPIQLVKAETNDLLVPADAEIVIEGEIRPQERGYEGPFGEYIGYIHGPRVPMPVLRVHAITHRKNPIFPFTACGFRLDINPCTLGTVSMAGLYAHLKYQRGWPVTSVHISAPFATNSAVLVATEVPFPGYIHHLAQYIFSTGVMAYLDFVFIFDADVDLTDADQVVEEITLKAHPSRDFHNVGLLTGPKSHLNIYQTPEEKKLGLPTSKVYVDCTSKKWDEATMGPSKLTFRTLFPEDVRQRAGKVIDAIK